MDDRNDMNRRPMWIPWAMTSLMLLVVAFIAFAMGARYDPVFEGEHVVHAGHWGFPGFFFGMLILLFCLGGLRRMWWWGGYPYRPWRYRRRDYDDPRDDEREWEEWHRRAHERMSADRTRSTTRTD